MKLCRLRVDQTACSLVYDRRGAYPVLGSTVTVIMSIIHKINTFSSVRL